MPGQAPGTSFSCTATKATAHNKPAVELNHAGIAAKSAQPPAMAPSAANAKLATEIAIGEEMTILMAGSHEFASSLLPGASAAGDRLAIKVSDNSLVKIAAGAAANKAIEEGLLVKFGVIDSIDATAGLAHVNLSQRSSF